MITHLARVTIVVRDQDEALRFYTEVLGFTKRADVQFGPGARWLTVAPPDQRELEIVLQQPDPAFHGEQQAAEMLAQVGKNPTWVLYSTDCQGDYGRLLERGVTFTSPPTEQPYGLEAVFLDLYDNSYSLLQPAEALG
ncbi:MAG TPA: VOC family protein [Ktedonobacterales bacterium]|nr:VOC family protein [Ktedonobacterales bacterium]